MKETYYYEIDSCTDEYLLFEKLDDLKKEGKIKWEHDDDMIIKITDKDLDDYEFQELVIFLEELEVYEYFGVTDLDYLDFDDEKPSRRKSKKSYDDYDDDNFSDYY